MCGTCGVLGLPDVLRRLATELEVSGPDLPNVLDRLRAAVDAQTYCFVECHYSHATEQQKDLWNQERHVKHCWWRARSDFGLGDIRLPPEMPMAPKIKPSSFDDVVTDDHKGR